MKSLSPKGFIAAGAATFAGAAVLKYWELIHYNWFDSAQVDQKKQIDLVDHVVMLGGLTGLGLAVFGIAKLVMKRGR
jgi:hypothetical protein